MTCLCGHLAAEHLHPVAGCVRRACGCDHYRPSSEVAKREAHAEGATR